MSRLAFLPEVASRRDLLLIVNAIVFMPISPSNSTTIAKQAAPARDAKGDVRITRSLKWFAYAASICATTGTFLYCYDESLALVRAPLIWTHDVTGDIALLFLGVYLMDHLKRTWGLRKSRPISWWTGVFAVAAWLLTAVGGVWGQVAPLVRYSPLWWTHAVGSVAAVVVASGHAAYGFRAKLFGGEQ